MYVHFSFCTHCAIPFLSVRECMLHLGMFYVTFLSFSPLFCCLFDVSFGYAFSLSLFPLSSVEFFWSEWVLFTSFGEYPHHNFLSFSLCDTYILFSSALLNIISSMCHTAAPTASRTNRRANICKKNLPILVAFIPWAYPTCIYINVYVQAMHGETDSPFFKQSSYSLFVLEKTFRVATPAKNKGMGGR